MATSIIEKKIVKQTYSKTGLSTANYYDSGTIDISKSGYTPIGVSAALTVALMHFTKCLINGNTLEWGVAMNQSTTNIPRGILTFNVVYARL